MRDIESYVRSLLADKGLILAGTSERALLRQDALRCVQLFRQGQVPILGGDVYHARGGELEPAYANWHADRAPGESLDEFVARASDVAWKYIHGFPERPGDVPAFVFVTAPKDA